jgi:hypothetical protein
MTTRTKTLLALPLMMLFPAAVRAQAVTPIFVELKSPAPTVVARWQAAQAGTAFDEELHRASIRLAQDTFLSELTGSGVSYTLTSTQVLVGGSAVSVPDRYTELINALHLVAAAEEIGRIRANPSVEHISVDEPLWLGLDHSAAYIRATGSDSARSRGLRGTGQANCDGSASGQVVAVLDTGIDHTNPMFDSRFDDSQFEERTADLRPVRLQGSPFVCDLQGNPLSHPKVAYRFLFAQAPVEGDDTGHGTNVASAAAGLKARADDVLNNGEIVEGIAPGAVLMDYKVCPSLSCNGTQILMSLEDAARERDLAGFPKPRATVVNMSFGSTDGDPNAASAVAAGNLQFLDTVPVASAGNSGPTENTVGSPSAGRRVVSVAATNDPGVGQWSADVLDPAGVDRDQTGAVSGSGLGSAAGERTGIALFRMAGTPAPPPGGLAQYYVFVRNGQLIDEWPASASGRIALVKTAQARLPSSTFAQIANNGALAGAVAVLFRTTTTNPTAVSAPIPAANIGLDDADYLICLMKGQQPPCDDPANGDLSVHPLRINPPGALFIPNTAGFSSRGPNNDFRLVKPDLTAPGVEILMGASKVGALGSPTGFTFASGTSFSGPQLAGSAALVRDVSARPGLSSSQVRAALMNSSTNLRFADQTTVPDTDARNFVHETGAGLVDMVRAVGLKALMGTNELNGGSGPDDSRNPDFLPSFSFGSRPLIGTGLPPTEPFQQARVTVTLADIGGEGGSYDLSLVDASSSRKNGGRGDGTCPLSEAGFSLTLSRASVSVPAGGSVTFDAAIAVDGTDGGLKPCGAVVTDLGIVVPVAGVRVTPVVRGLQAAEFLWYVVATRSDGTESLRMPFALRVINGVPGGGQVGVASGGGWIPNGEGKDHFRLQAEGTDPANGEISFSSKSLGVKLTGSVGSASVNGHKASFSGPCTLQDGAACSYTAEVEDNADPGRGADRFSIRVTTADGKGFDSSGVLGGGNIDVDTF